MTSERKIFGVFGGGRFHWVGDGFRVHNYFPSGNDLEEKTSPFFLMDYHAPHAYPPSEKPRGVGVHPHRGFETVTLAFDGAVAHHDSAGNAGVIRPGDVQWMTAASGILHKEYHEAEFSRRGGTMHMMQLWVNLPAAHKMSPPRYQELSAARMGRVELANGGGVVRVVAGELSGVKGPAQTFTPIDLWDVTLQPGGRLTTTFRPHDNTLVLVMSGEVTVNRTLAKTDELVVLDDEGDEVTIEAQGEARVLVLSGAPLREPVVAYGPFVMNTEQEIREAVADFNAGKFGALV